MSTLPDRADSPSDPDAKKRTRSTISRNILISVVSVLFAVLLGEIVLRSFFAGSITLFPRFHTRADYGEFVLRKTRPNTTFQHHSIDGTWTFTINAQGFRDSRNYPYEKPPGRLRILALGDSQTEGYEVRQEETWAAGLERYLAREGVDSEVFNMGISGFSTAEILAFLESEGVRYKPDVVVYGLFVNDFRDNVRVGLYRLEDGRAVPAKREFAPLGAISDFHNNIPPLRWLSQHSYFYSFVTNTTVNHLRRLGKRQAEAEAALEYAVPVGELNDVQEKLMLALVERMHNVCRANGVRLLIVDIPAISPRAPRGYRSSVPEKLVPALRKHSEAFFSADELLAEYREVAVFHAPHGHRHISALTHAQIAVALGKAIRPLAMARATAVEGVSPRP